MAWLCLTRLRFKREKRKSEKKILHESGCKIRRTYIESTATYSKNDEYIRTINFFLIKEGLAPSDFHYWKPPQFTRSSAQLVEKPQFKGRRHKGQWSTVRSIETLESSIVGSCSVCMISPSSCTTISRLGPGYYKALPSHILYYFKVH